MIPVKINKKKIFVKFAIILMVLFVVNVLLVKESQALYEISDGSIKALYHFSDETDSSGNGYNLTNNHASTFGTGLLTTATYLDGTNDYFNSSATVFNSATTTYGIWFYITQGTSYQVIASRRDAGGTFGWELARDLNSPYALRLTCRGASACDIIGTIQLTTGWHYAWISYNSSSISLYQDGVLVATDPAPYGVMTGTADLLLGKRPAGDFLNGRLDETFYSTSTISTTTHLALLYNSGSGNEICVTAGCDDVVPTTSVPTLDIGEEYDNIDQITMQSYTYSTSTGATTSSEIAYFHIPFALWLVFYLIFIPIIMRLILELIIRFRQ